MQLSSCRIPARQCTMARPHLVWNLEDTVSITHKYADEYPNVHQLVDSIQKSETQLFQVWLPKIKQCWPDLFISGS
jgi:hypothetical protein